MDKLAGTLIDLAILLAKNVLPPFRITVAASAIDAGIQKKIRGSGITILIILNKEMNDKGNLLSRKRIVRAGSEKE